MGIIKRMASEDYIDNKYFENVEDDGMQLKEEFVPSTIATKDYVDNKISELIASIPIAEEVGF